MLDFGWQEFLVIAIVTVLVVGPRELPRVFRTITGFMRKARSLAGEFQGAMNEIAREADLEDLKKEAQKLKKGESDWVKNIDPTGEVGDSVRAMKDEVEQTRAAVNKAGQTKTGEAKKPEVKINDPPEMPSSLAAKTAGGTQSASSGADGTAKSAGTKKAAAKKAGSKKSAPKAGAAKKAVAKKASAAKAAPKKASAKKTAAKKAPAAKPSGDPA